MARGYGAALAEPYAREVWGLESQPLPWEGSALVEWDMGVPDPDGAYPPPDDVFNPHDTPRVSQAGMMQAGEFILQGVVNQHCDGICDPE